MAKTQYEGMFLFPGSAEVEASLKRVRTIIENHGGSIIHIKKWDERKLTYEIKKQKRGLFILAFYTAPGAAVAAVTRDVNLSDDILRVLIVDASHLSKDEMEKVEPQPIIVQAPSDRGGFGGFGGFGTYDSEIPNVRPSRGGPRRRDEETAGA